jgi:hypothetical protein
MSDVGMLPIASIRRDGGTQIRVEFDETTADEFAEMLVDGHEFPPVVVFFDGADYWLADGFHRMRAHERAWREEIVADVREGSLRDAILYAVGANAAHGIRRTNKCKKNAVLTLLRDAEWSQWTDSEIARRCAVHQTTVMRHRHEISLMQSIGEPGLPRIYVNRHGTTSTMNTANIGVRPPPEFIDSDATWHRPDAYRSHGEEAAHPDYRQMDIEELAPGAPGPAPEPLQFPPRHLEAKLAGGAISDALQTIAEQSRKATPAEVVAALGGELWTDAGDAEKVIPWLTEFVRLIPDEMSRRERSHPYLAKYRRRAARD